MFGMMNGKLLGAGEAGSETVVGTSSLMDMIGDAVDDGLTSFGMTANDAINVLRNRDDIQMPEFTEDGEAWVKRYERERLVELAFVNHRFWDVRRWKKGAQYFKTIQTASISGNLMLTRSNVSRQWDDKYYFYPIPQSEMKKNSHLTQNPGW